MQAAGGVCSLPKSLEPILGFELYSGKWPLVFGLRLHIDYCYLSAVCDLLCSRTDVYSVKPTRCTKKKKSQTTSPERNCPARLEIFYHLERQWDSYSNCYIRIHCKGGPGFCNFLYCLISAEIHMGTAGQSGSGAYVYFIVIQIPWYPLGKPARKAINPFFIRSAFTRLHM